LLPDAAIGRTRKGVERGVPHGGAETLASDGVAALVVWDGVALVGSSAVCTGEVRRLRRPEEAWWRR
jgi:hypothetical protein